MSNLEQHHQIIQSDSEEAFYHNQKLNDRLKNSKSVFLIGSILVFKLWLITQKDWKRLHLKVCSLIIWTLLYKGYDYEVAAIVDH